MDTITQSLLGASIGGAAMGAKLGPRALLIGGAVAILPDFDSLIIGGDAIERMTYHRGASHSFFVQTAAAAPLTWLVTRLVKGAKAHWPLLLLTVWLCLITHSMLDSLTTYGTQVFWPLHFGPPVAFPAVFIIDPLYSSLLLAGVLTVWLRRKKPDRGLKANRILLGLSCLYLGLGLVSHGVVEARAADKPAFKDMRIFAQPMPFNILFWQVLGVDGEAYASAYSTALPGCPVTAVSRMPRLAEPPVDIPLADSVERLEWFTDGFYSYHDKGGAIAITDLRLGFMGAYPFSFEIARRKNDSATAIRPRQVPIGERGLEDLLKLYRRGITNLRECRW